MKIRLCTSLSMSANGECKNGGSLDSEQISSSTPHVNTVSHVPAFGGDSEQIPSSTPHVNTVSPVSAKRCDYLDWTEYFMAVSFLSAMRSKDPVTQVGACIVNADRKIVGIGYNGMPLGCSDDLLPWGKHSSDPLANKYMYVCHAEMNAIMNKNSADVRGCTLYVALFPCNECSKLIIQAGIVEVVYASDKNCDKPSTVAAKRLLDMAGIRCTRFQPRCSQVVIDFDSINSDRNDPHTG